MASSNESLTNHPTTNKSIQCKPLVSLQPIKRNLPRIETERIYRVLQNTTRVFEECQVLMSVIKDDTKLFSITDNELRDLVLKQQDLVQEFESGNESIQDEMIDSLKDIFRYLYRKGTSIISRDPQIDTGTCMSDLSENFKGLSHVILEKLLTEKEEETMHNKYMLRNMEKARASRKMIIKLESTLNEKVKEKEHDLNECDRVIRHMQQEIDKIISAANDENNLKLNESAKLILTSQKNQDFKKAKAHQEVIDLKKKWNSLRTTNFVEESALRKRKFKMSTELRNWIRKYDQDMGWRQEEFDELKADNEKDLEAIREAEIHFVEVETKYNAIMEERRLLREAEEKALRQKVMEYESAVNIQSLWRGFQVRNDIKKKEAAAAKKAKKGKKK